MKRYLIFVGITIIIVILIIMIIFNKKDNQSNQNTSNLSNNTISSAHNEEILKNETTNLIENSNEISQITTNETELSSYKTTIKDKEAGRLTNISITCSTLNNTILHPNETFSFNAIVGKPTAERGYQEANIIIDHKTERGIGGGNCQVSSTLYNAVLNVPNLVVIERHEHGKDVTYVPEGKDAAVSFRFFRF